MTIARLPQLAQGFVPPHHVLSASPRSVHLQASQQQQQHLVLVGGGHAHVQVIKALAQRPHYLKVTLIDAQSSASYSGMVPGCVAGLYSMEQTQLRLEPLAQWAGLEFIRERVVDLDGDQKMLKLRDGRTVNFDVVSLDIGSTVQGLQHTPGARRFTIPTRPIDQLITRLESVRSELKNSQGQNQQQRAGLVVIGGGAAGIELALSVSSRWQKDSIPTSTTILDAGSVLLPGESLAVQETVQTVLDNRKIRVRHGSHVVEITDDHVCLKDGSKLAYTHCIWATGAGPHALARRLQNRGLECDKHGWIMVTSTLQSVSHPYIFAAGDCASIVDLPEGRSPPKAGVYAVRSGPILLQNLTAYLQSMRDGPPTHVSLKQYAPQDDFLKLIGCGDGKALGFRFGMVMQGEWVFQLKDSIDQNFMKLFDVSDLPRPSPNSAGKYDTAQYDAEDDFQSSPLTSNPRLAAALLQRTDGDVDYRQAKVVLRAMGQDQAFREAVLSHVSKQRPRSNESGNVCVAVESQA